MRSRIKAERLAPARPIETPNQATFDLRKAVSCPTNGGCLALNSINRLHELRSSVRRRICNDDDSQAVTLAPKDIHAIWYVRTCRLEQCPVKYLLRDAISLHASLCVAAYCNVPKSRYIAI